MLHRSNRSKKLSDFEVEAQELVMNEIVDALTHGLKISKPKTRGKNRGANAKGNFSGVRVMDACHWHEKDCWVFSLGGGGAELVGDANRGTNEGKAPNQ
jgi:hypothetical protein